MNPTSSPTGLDKEREVIEVAVFGALKADANALPFCVVAEGLPWPKNFAGKSLEGQPRGRIIVRPGTVNRAEIGTQMRRNVGQAILQVFLPKDTGTQLGVQAADLLEPLAFTSVALPGGVGSIDFGCPSSLPAGTDAATGFLQINVSLPYTREVFVAPTALSASTTPFVG